MLQVSSNSVVSFKRFVYTNYSNTNASVPSLEYNLSIWHTEQNVTDESFHIYVIRSDIIPHFDLMTNPAVCCSRQGGYICDDNFNSDSKASLLESNQLKNYALYTKDVYFEDSNSIEIQDVRAILNVIVS